MLLYSQFSIVLEYVSRIHENITKKLACKSSLNNMNLFESGTVVI